MTPEAKREENSLEKRGCVHVKLCAGAVGAVVIRAGFGRGPAGDSTMVNRRLLLRPGQAHCGFGPGLHWHVM